MVGGVNMVNREITIKYTTNKNEHGILVASGSVEFKGLIASEVNKLESSVGKILKGGWL